MSKLAQGCWAPRLRRLTLGLLLFGVSLGLLVRAEIGLPAWDVLHQGLAQRTGASLGTVVIAVSLLVLLTWVPLRQRPGLGTVADALLVGLVVDATLRILPPATGVLPAVALLALGIVVNAAGTALYLGAGLGPGTRDGLMTGLAARGHSIRAVRTGIELGVLAVGWLLGGTVGPGTLVFALTIGPLVQRLLPRLAFGPPLDSPPAAPHAPHPQRGTAMHQLVILVASTRPGRVGPLVAEWFAGQVGPELDFEVQVVDLADDRPPHAGRAPSPLPSGATCTSTPAAGAAIVDAADAFVVVTPEYNVGFTAPLKNALDYLYAEWHHKPVGFVSYGMTSAGLRAVEMLKPGAHLAEA